jgi:hypothetical protein
MITWTVYTLRIVNPEEKSYEATSVYLYSTKEKAVEAFLSELRSYNEHILEGNGEEEDLYDLDEAQKEIETEGYFDDGIVSYVIGEYTLDSDKMVD